MVIRENQPDRKLTLGTQLGVKKARLRIEAHFLVIMCHDTNTYTHEGANDGSIFGTSMNKDVNLRLSAGITI